MGESITEGTLNEWKKKAGDSVVEDEVVAVVDTDKVSLDINAPTSGMIAKVFAQPGDTVMVGADLFEVEEGAAGQQHETHPAASSVPAADASAPASLKSAPPAADRPQPASAAAKAAPASGRPEATSAASRPHAPPTAVATERSERRVPMSRLRKRIAERLKLAQNSAAALTTFQECDMSNLLAMRLELNDEFVKAHGRKFGFVSPFLLSATRALQKMPEVNAYISENGDEIIYKDYVDISIAVATPTGLLVPVLRDCHRKTLAELERELADMAVRAREGKIALEDMAGGTFTISNGGVFGSLLGTPILNPPQSSILGLHATKERPVVRDGQIVIRPIMYLALTYDHRLVDGREAVTFLNLIKDGVEDPRRLLLGV